MIMKVKKVDTEVVTEVDIEEAEVATEEATKMKVKMVDTEVATEEAEVAIEEATKMKVKKVNKQVNIEVDIKEEVQEEVLTIDQKLKQFKTKEFKMKNW